MSTWMHNLHLSGARRDGNHVLQNTPRRSFSISSEEPFASPWCPLSLGSTEPGDLPGPPSPPHCRFSLSARRRLERNLFNCSCDIRWIQLWQEKGEANLQSQELYCMNMDTAVIPLQEMNITQCGKGQPVPWGSPVLFCPFQLTPLLREADAIISPHVVKNKMIEADHSGLWIKYRVSG